MNELVRDLSIPNDWDRRGLPGWTYHSDALLELEKQHIFREHWQLACHVSDLPDPGNYLTLDIVGERALAAIALARAERAMRESGLTVEWEWDESPDLSWMDEKEAEKPHECLVAFIRSNGRTLAALGGIVDPDRPYARVIEAELALEAGFGFDWPSEVAGC